MQDLVQIRLPGAGRLTAELVVAACFEGAHAAIEGAPAQLSEALSQLQSRRRFSGQKGSRLETTFDDGRRSLILSGLGQPEDLHQDTFSSWLGGLIQAAREREARKLAICLPLHEQTRGRGAALRILRGLALSAYRFDAYKQPGPRIRLGTIQLLPPEGEARTYRACLPTALAIAEGVAYARDLGNTPPNIATPSWLTSQARALARDAGMQAAVLGVKELERRGMGGILAVGRGSTQPPRLVRLRWGAKGPVVALVGKGVTFDTGGISIKPAADMDEMKYDKCGACTALGVARAVTRLGLPVRLRLYLPLAENMPDGRAYRPADIVRCYNKKTVEIVNTDAEGRMILADALSWAAQGKPDFILEFSTLTGAAVAALGEFAAALYTPAEDLAAELLGGAAGAGERLWRMPLWPEYLAQMKSHHADLKNTGGRWGGANTAAAFLSEFVDGHEQWAHLDIAGPAMSKSPKEASGFGVALTLHWLTRMLEDHGTE